MTEAYLSGRVTQAAELYKEIVENARMATGALVVHLYWFDSKKRRTVRIASSALAPRMQMGLQEVQRNFPDFRPEQVVTEVTVNSLLQRVFLEGKTVRATLEEIAAGVVDSSIIQSVKKCIGIGHVFTSPLIWRGRVFAALCFHHSEPITRATEVICEAFARQVTLTMENAYLLSESRRHVEELRRSRALLTEAEEELRRKLAEFLHGHIQSHLLVAWHRLADASRLVHSEPEAAAGLIEECRRLIDKVREEDVRKVSHKLHPAIIQVGLIPALRSLADTYRDHLDVCLDVDAEVVAWDNVVHNRIPERVRLTVYRVVEEALANACRHGRASSAEVRLSACDDTLQVSVVDDGVGLARGKVQLGLALESIEARLSQLGGSWQLRNNEVGCGTTLTVAVPLQTVSEKVV